LRCTGSARLCEGRFRARLQDRNAADQKPLKQIRHNLGGTHSTPFRSNSIMAAKSKNKDEKVSDIWLPRPSADDFTAAEEYLSLLFPAAKAERLVSDLRRAPVIYRQAKDLLRASQTHLLEQDNPHVARQIRKIRKGKRMSPVLLLRGDGKNGITVTIADGHHRICASWYWDEDAPVACCLAAIPR
jgi:hypothetical protein